MNAENFQNQWETVKEQLGYPNINIPKITKGKVDTACINMQTKEIEINQDFLNEVAKYGSNEEAFEVIAAHEANHYVLCPYDLKTLMLLDFEANKINNQTGTDLANYFEDVIINIDLVNKGFDGIKKAYYEFGTPDAFTETLRALYMVKTDHNFGLQNEELINYPALKAANQIDYENTEKEALRKNVKDFTIIFSQLNPPKRKFTNALDYDRYSDFDIDDAFKGMMRELTPEEYAQAKEYAKQKNISNRILDRTLAEYYEAITKKYYLKIAQKTKTKIDEEETITPWETADSINNVDVFKSNAKYYPDITKKKSSLRKLAKENVEGEEAPNALIAIDSSASMTNPYKEKSYAVMAGFIIADFYLKKTKNVAILNFGDQSIIQDYTFFRKKIQDGLLTYQRGLTSINIYEFLNLATKTPADIYIISDEAISNYDSLISGINTNPNIKNVSIIGVESYKKTNSPKIRRYALNEEKDFLKFATKEVKKRNEEYI